MKMNLLREGMTVKKMNDFFACKKNEYFLLAHNVSSVWKKEKRNSNKKIVMKII